MYRFPATLCFIVIILLALACGNGDSVTPLETPPATVFRSTDSTSGNGDSSPATESPTENPNTKSSEPPDDETETLLLGQQIVVTATGGGGSGSCWDDAEQAFADREYAAWLGSFDTEQPLALPLTRQAVVCLKGFSTGDQVQVQVATASRAWDATVTVSEEVSDQAFPGALDVSPGVLPTGISIVAVGTFGRDESVRGTDSWTFLPTSDERDHLVKEGELLVTAEQGVITSAEVQQTIEIPGPEIGWVDPQSTVLFVSGLPAHSKAEVGIFMGEPPNATDSIVEFVRKVNVLDIPASRVAGFALPADVLSLRGNEDHYCVAIATVEDCLFV